MKPGNLRKLEGVLSGMRVIDRQMESVMSGIGQSPLWGNSPTNIIRVGLTHLAGLMEEIIRGEEEVAPMADHS